MVRRKKSWSGEHHTITLSTSQLRRLCDHAQRLGFARGPNEEFWAVVDPAGEHECLTWMEHWPRLALWKGIDHGFNFDHNGGLNVRVMILCRLKGLPGLFPLVCDFDWHDWQALLQAGPRQAV